MLSVGLIQSVEGSNRRKKMDPPPNKREISGRLPLDFICNIDASCLRAFTPTIGSLWAPSLLPPYRLDLLTSIIMWVNSNQSINILLVVFLWRTLTNTLIQTNVYSAYTVCQATS